MIFQSCQKLQIFVAQLSPSELICDLVYWYSTEVILHDLDYNLFQIKKKSNFRALHVSRSFNIL